MASENPPPVDAADFPLLMTLDQLRKPGGQDINVTFLRRTQYIAAQASGGRNAVFSPSSRQSTRTSAAAAAASKPKPKPSRNDPMHVKKYIQKGFDIAYPHSKHTGDDTPSRIRGMPPAKADIDAWNNPQHPENPRLKPVGSYPFIPDLTGFNDTAGFVQLKFDKPPVGAMRGNRDDRMDVAIVVPSIPEEKVTKEFEAKKALHNANPAVYPDPGPQPPLDYDLYLPDGDDNPTSKVRAALNTENPTRDDDGNYTHEHEDGTKSFQYDHLRSYSTSTATYNILENSYKDVALTLFDPAKQDEVDDAGHGTKNNRLKQKGAYYYPVLTKSRLQPERPRVHITQTGAAAATTKRKSERVISRLNVRMRDANAEEQRRRAEHRAQIDSKFSQIWSKSEDADEGGREKRRRSGEDAGDDDDDGDNRGAASTGVEDVEE